MALLLLLLGLFLCGPSSAQARDLQQTEGTEATTITPLSSDVDLQAASGSTRQGGPAVNLFTAVSGPEGATASVDDINLPKEVEVVTTLTASECGVSTSAEQRSAWASVQSLLAKPWKAST